MPLGDVVRLLPVEALAVDDRRGHACLFDPVRRDGAYALRSELEFLELFVHDRVGVPMTIVVHP